MFCLLLLLRIHLSKMIISFFIVLLLLLLLLLLLKPFNFSPGQIHPSPP